jgi:NAD+ diphosphatase
MTPVGPPPVDRVDLRRLDDAWLAQRWADGRTRVLHVADGRAETVGSPPRLVLVAPYATSEPRVLLGVDVEDVAYFAVLGERPPEAGGPPREVVDPPPRRPDLDAFTPLELALTVQAVGLANWHAAHPRCPRCGAATEPVAAGHLRRCPKDGSEHHPRTDPAVIMLVTDAEDRALLGRHIQWPAPLFSTLAGFVEPGESAEDAVAREVLEEAGIVVEAVGYAGSQPWPFPSSLMLGFRARAHGSPEPVPDLTEMAEVRWFSRAELATEFAAGSVLLPPRASIARRLIEDWFGGPLG